MATRFMVGDLEVIGVSDGTVAFKATQYFAGTTDEQWQAHKRWLNHDGDVVFEYGCFVVRSGDRRVLIDTGVGPVEIGPFKGGALMSDLASAGIQPEDIDEVFITHLHFDHCGSAALKNGGGEMQPAFPKAKYRWTAAEHEYWHSDDGKKRAMRRSDVLDAVGPLLEAADDGTPLAPGISVIALPGHTPGHAGVVLSSGTDRAFILGDAISCPVQLEETEWSGLGDVDPKLARRTQEALAREGRARGPSSARVISRG
jgi:glyoxylase-like metal-dependent hydrolase (beta-lactamase superfamily II)